MAAIGETVRHILSRDSAACKEFEGTGEDRRVNGNRSASDTFKPHRTKGSPLSLIGSVRCVRLGDQENRKNIEEEHETEIGLGLAVGALEFLPGQYAPESGNATCRERE